MKKPLFLLVTLVLCFALLTGCDKEFFDPEQAIQAPAAAGKYQGVQQALEDAVGQDMILKYPSVQGTNTAFYLIDLDKDGADEVLAFYQSGNEGSVTHAHLLRKVEDEWQSVQDIEPVGTDIIQVEFADLDGDGVDEVCIGWSVAASSVNQMSIYQLTNQKLVQCANESYTKFILCDIDNDRVNELGLATLDGERQTSTFSFYQIQNNAIQVLGSIALDGSVISYANMSCAGINQQVNGVFLDCYKGVDTMITELICFDDGTLYNPFAGMDQAVNVSTMRYCSLTAQDVNQDGVVEVPFMELLPAYEESKDQAITRYTLRWRYYDGALSQPVSTWWYNSIDGYYLVLDESWLGKFTVLYNTSEKSYGFYAWNGETVGDILFTIKTFTAEQFKSVSKTYQTVGKTASTVWAVELNAKNSLSITQESVKNCFRIID